MPNPSKHRALAFEVDKLTRSIENVVTGDSFQTVVLPLTKEDLMAVAKKRGWLFDWKLEFKSAERKVFKLTTVENPNVVQGLVSLEVKPDHVAMQLVESAPHNLGKNKVYDGVMGNLVAFVCKVSVEHGFEGNVVFLAKTKLIHHYTEKLKAVHVGGHLMVIYPPAARYLVEQYFP
ncbi:MAG: hypothetical protein IT230_13525 [Flavobacteriales bacterium]|nr:hypothetical protein [Flavobacteriales bacterium]